MKVLDTHYLHSFEKELSRDVSYKNELHSDPLKSDEILQAMYAYYEMYEADSTRLAEIRSGLARDSNSKKFYSTGIYCTQRDGETFYEILLTHYVPDGDISAQTLGERFRTMSNDIRQTISELKGVWHRPTNEILLRLKDAGCKGLDSNVRIKLMTNVIPTKADRKKAQKQVPEDDRITFVYGDDIEYEILEIEDPREYVEKASLILNEPGNILRFGESRIVSVSARSLKNLYEEYHYRGLFAQNLRYYVKNEKVDGVIVDTIKNRPDLFWYFNNGIIIICDSFSLSGTKIELINCSIVNGGQTTKLIGETEFDTDFFVTCKVIVCPEKLLKEKTNFISDVAQASNTQKPINATDLVANRVEQREMKKYLADNGICCRVKRGERANKKLYPKSWQNTTNEEVGQMLLAFLHQLPGTARNSKSMIFKRDDLYRQIFVGVRHDAAFIGDLLKIKHAVSQWNTDISKTELALVKNGLYSLVAQVGLVYKLYTTPQLLSEVTNQRTDESKRITLSHCDVDHTIFSLDPNNPEKKLLKLLYFCMDKFYYPSYTAFSEKIGGAYSNFTKLDSYYLKFVLTRIVQYFEKGLTDEDKALLDDCFHKPTAEEQLRDNLLYKEHPISYTPNTRESGLTKQVKDEVKLALQKNYPKAKVPAKLLTLLVSDPPKSKLDLQLKGMKEELIAQLGDFIINAIQEAFNRLQGENN